MDQFGIVLVVSVLLGVATAQPPCPTDWKQSPLDSNKCVLAVDKLRTWSDANAYCGTQAATSTLITISSAFEQNFIFQLIQPNHALTPAVWIGLYEVSPGKYAWTDQSTSNYRNWAVGEPDPTGQCVTMDAQQTGKWTTSDCTLSRSFICELYLSPPCAEGWTYNADLKACYKVFEDAYKTWHESAIECRKLGARLPAIQTKNESDFIASLVSNDNYWVGLFSMSADSSVWLWSDGELPDYYCWNDGKPNSRATNFCTLMIGRHDPAGYGKWSNEICTAQFSFVCKHPARGIHQC